jgi:hypothetical protein
MRDLARIERGMNRATRGLIWADAGLSVAFVLVLVLGPYLMGESAAPGGPGPDRVVEAESAAQFSASDVEKATTGKVLFRTSASSLKEKVVDELAHFELKGISTRGGRKLAHVRDNKLKKLVTKKVGDTLGAYEIVDITDEGVTVRRGAEDVILSKG